MAANSRIDTAEAGVSGQERYGTVMMPEPVIVIRRLCCGISRVELD
jgi:hypothetical protein